ncbi:ATP-grasp domain-containing protein [Pseudodesulfovibrio sp.]|uniref:ATP-grasp domain-containing protein n=1 Tax=Pseudodesulfovibrio sp. TaxID=2035812 RepID=UPI0026053F12|nr:ATP-grasp domain-containing protein [Pseudodesulfovibrio sp.]MDD3312308.1 ATP-grasp domain-containing protein [Pseudodesulfovibrio sp.]
MVILEKPYVSDLLLETLVKMGVPVLDNEVAREAAGRESGQGLNVRPEEAFIRLYRENPVQPVYSNSENAIEWVKAHLDGGDLPDRIGLFKDKAAFRDLVRDLWPDFRYRTVRFEDLGDVDPAEVPIPCVLKPCVGFFSLGVHMVESVDGFRKAVRAVREEVGRIRSMYPAEVLKLDNFIIEQCIEGEEFAVDAYFDAAGAPVILNIFSHLFASSDDVGDRCYFTSSEIIAEHHDRFLELLQQIGNRANLRNFPLHIEVRVDGSGNVGVIEVNPMRFAGWCVTDLAWHAYGVNPYTCFMEGKAPDWRAICAARQGKVYAMVIGDIDASVDRANVASVDYAAFLSAFSNPLELRRIDYREYPVFAFVFAEVDRENLDELKRLLPADFGVYLKMA